MPRCVYCKTMYEIPRGLTLIMKDGTINHLCSSKCRKNMLMKRRKVRWISKAKKSKEDLQKEVLARSAENKEHKEAQADVEKAAPKVEEKTEEKPAEKKTEEKK
jgi:ribosomal protein L24E